jgi:hypothetical protein
MFSFPLSGSPVIHVVDGPSPRSEVREHQPDYIKTYRWLLRGVVLCTERGGWGGAEAFLPLVGLRR